MTIRVKAVGDPHGVIEDYTFPSAVEVGEQDAVSVTAHNTGETGTHGFAIVNKIGNPGSIVLRMLGDTFVIEPEHLRIIYHDNQPNCHRFTEAGTITFSVVGTYTVLLWGVWKIGEKWWYDSEEEIKLTVVVEEEEIPEEPPTFWEQFTGYIQENPLVVAATLGSVMVALVVFRGGVRGEHKRS